MYRSQVHQRFRQVLIGKRQRRQSSSSHSHEYRHPRYFLAVSAVAAGSLAWVDNNEDAAIKEGDAGEMFASNTFQQQAPPSRTSYSSSWQERFHPFLVDLPNSSSSSTPTTLCEESKPVKKSFLRQLLRMKSVDRIKHLADKRKLEDVYEVDWEWPLGEGGFGAVFLARDKKTKQKVALKKISKEFTTDDGFQREMEAFLQIRNNGGHPNICGLHDYFDEGGDYYLSLDLISGGEMFDHLINAGPYSEADAARLVQEVARALAFLHGIGICHGDLKPENLMLSTSNTSDAVVKVIDFGTAQVLDENGNPMVKLGGGRTEAYCPPEVLKRRGPITRVDPSMDMWALGVILYVMLVGAHPFDLYGDESDEEIMRSVVRGDPIPLGEDDHSEFSAHLSEDSQDLIRRLLCYNQKDRMTAYELFQHPWVQGITASHKKMAEINSKLQRFRKMKTKLELQVFEDLFSFADERTRKHDDTNKMSLIERSFRKLDTEHKGFITAKDMGDAVGGQVGGSDDAAEETSEENALTLSTFSSLLSDSMRNEYYQKNDVIYREGDKGHDMLFINSGVVEVTTKSGFRTTLKQGDFVGESSLLSDTPRSATVKCLTPVHAIKITKEYFDKYLASSESGLSLKILEKEKDRESSRIIFSGFSDLLSANMKNEAFNEGAVIYKEGEKDGDTMFFINSGVVEVSNKAGFRTTLQQGDYFGESALLSKTSKPRSATVKCLTPVEGMKITKEYFDKYLMSSDHSALSLKMRERDRQRNVCRTNAVLRKFATQDIDNNSKGLELSDGDLIYNEGDLEKNLYIVDEGIVEIVVAGYPVLKLKQGDIFGEHSLIFGTPRNASARCVTGRCKVLELGPKDVTKILKDNSPFLRESIKDTSLRRDFQKAVVFKTRKEFPTTPKALKTAFRAVTSTDTITLPMMASILRNMNPGIQEKDIQAIFDSIDVNGKGSIDFATFKLIFGFE